MLVDRVGVGPCPAPRSDIVPADEGPVFARDGGQPLIPKTEGRRVSYDKGYDERCHSGEHDQPRQTLKMSVVGSVIATMAIAA